MDKILGKSREDRASDIASLLQDIDTNGVKPADVPADVVALVDKLNMVALKDLLPNTIAIDKADLRAVVTKKGTTLYSVLDSGFGLTAIKKAGSRTLKVKLQLVIV